MSIVFSGKNTRPSFFTPSTKKKTIKKGKDSAHVAKPAAPARPSSHHPEDIVQGKGKQPAGRPASSNGNVNGNADEGNDGTKGKMSGSNSLAGKGSLMPGKGGLGSGGGSEASCLALVSVVWFQRVWSLVICASGGVVWLYGGNRMVKRILYLDT